MPQNFAILLPALTVSLLLVLTEGSHFASKDTALPSSSAFMSDSNIALMYSIAAFSQGVPMRTKMSSYLPNSAMFAMFLTTVSGSAEARYSRITLKKRLSPKPPLMSRAKKRVFIAMSLSSANALMNLAIISSSSADLNAPAVAKRSKQKDSVPAKAAAPFSVLVLFASFLKKFNIFFSSLNKVPPGLPGIFLYPKKI